MAQRLDKLPRAYHKHGHTIAKTVDGVSSTYETWRNMKQRVTNPNKDSYKFYGGKGIKLCDRWYIFANFLEDMGERPEGMSIDRIDHDGNYEPSNCRWVDSKLNNSRK